MMNLSIQTSLLILLLPIAFNLPSTIGNYQSDSTQHNFGDGRRQGHKQNQRRHHESSLKRTYHEPDGFADNKSSIVNYCDSNYCDSIVTKCQLTERCKCDWKFDAKCGKDCVDCLEEKFGRCCACVGLCQDPRNLNHNNYYSSSHVANLPTQSKDLQLFDLLTEEEDPRERWTIYKLPNGRFVNHPLLGRMELAYRYKEPYNRIAISSDERMTKSNCVVAFINRELGISKCKSYCISMGSSSFRWFQNNCCECVGQFCFDYGIDEPRCKLPNF